MVNKIQIQLREASPHDLPLILEFIRELAQYEKLSNIVCADEETLRKNLFGERPYAHVILAYHDDEPLGFALYFFNFSTFLGKPGLYLEDIYVRPAFRGLGVGKQLLKQLALIALENNCGRMEWSVLDWNEPSIGFYKKLGAVAMDEWTVFRLEGKGIENLAVASRQ